MRKGSIKNAVMIGALIAMAVVAIIGTVILSKREVENGFIKVEGQELTWAPEDLPVVVYVDPTSVKMLDVINDVLDDWGSVVGRQTFTLRYTPGWSTSYARREACRDPLDAGPDDPVIFLTVAEEAILGEGGHATLHWNRAKKIRCVDIVISPDVSEGLIRRVLMHEFGHALGLMHDGDPHSVMFFGILPSGRGLDTVTDADRERLREAYGRDSLKL